MNEDIQKLFEAGEFSQEFKDSATAIFESAVEDRVAQLAEEIEQRYSKSAEEYAEYVVETLQEKSEDYVMEEVVPMVERYLQYSVDEFMKENKLAIESGVKVELAESFLSGISGLAESFNVVVPAGKDDVVAKLEANLKEMQDRFDALLEEKAELTEQIKQVQKDKIIDSKIADLTESQKEKFRGVANKIVYRDDAQFKSAVDELFESYHPTESKIIQKSLNENTDDNTQKQRSWLDDI